MLERALRTAAVLASGCVVLSFVLFALDESREASRESQEAIAGRSASRTADPSPSQERARERAHSTVREAIDDVDDVLLAPFPWAEPDGGDKWARRGLPALVALAVYGFGLGFLARFSRGRA